MKALVGLTISLLGLFPIAVPDRRGEPPREIVLTNTTWTGVDGEWVTTYRFEPDGVLFYSYTTGTYRNGTWRVDGNELYLQINNKFYQFRGTINDDTIVGEAWNVKGDRWRCLLRLQR
jgi:hypothetical protein